MVVCSMQFTLHALFCPAGSTEGCIKPACDVGKMHIIAQPVLSAPSLKSKVGLQTLLPARAKSTQTPAFAEERSFGN